MKGCDEMLRGCGQPVPVGFISVPSGISGSWECPQLLGQVTRSGQARSCSKLVVENTSKIETHKCFGGEEERRIFFFFKCQLAPCLSQKRRRRQKRREGGGDSPLGEEEDGKLLRKPLGFLA